MNIAAAVVEFDRFVGIDWSGSAQKRYPGIAVAECRPGRAAPTLVPPPDGVRRWTRGAVLEWLLVQLTADERLMVGFDFAFGLPGAGKPLDQLWTEVEAHCRDEPDLLGRRYAGNDPRFWHRGAQPANWNAGQRATEEACITAKLGNPQTPFHLIGAKQVGKGALAGMRLLHSLRKRASLRIAVWPLDVDGPTVDGRSICVEIYPRLFIRRAGLGNRKLRTLADLNGALNQLDSIGILELTFDDHQADALVSSAGLRQMSRDASVWKAGARQAEGWIFGVP